MSFICKKYNTECTVDMKFCSKRHKKALDNPDDLSIDPCRTCEVGIEAWATLKLEATPPQPGQCRLCHCVTTNPTGICTACKQKTGREIERDRILSSKILQKEKEAMKRANKKCPKCGKEARSNVQQTCECGFVFFQKGIPPAPKEKKPIDGPGKTRGIPHLKPVLDAAEITIGDGIVGQMVQARNKHLVEAWKINESIKIIGDITKDPVIQSAALANIPAERPSPL